MCSYSKICLNKSYYQVMDKHDGNVIDCCWKCLTEIDVHPVFGGMIEQCPPESENYKLMRPPADKHNIWVVDGVDMWLEGSNTIFNQDAIDWVMG